MKSKIFRRKSIENYVVIRKRKDTALNNLEDNFDVQGKEQGVQKAAAHHTEYHLPSFKHKAIHLIHLLIDGKYDKP